MPRSRLAVSRSLRSSLTALALAGQALVGLSARAQMASPAAGAAPRPPIRAIGQTVSTDPLAAPFGFVSGEYERAIGRRGLAVGVGGLTSVGRSPEAPNDGGSDVFRSLQLKLKYYPRQDGLGGLAVGVTLGVAHERELWYGSSMIDASGREVWLQRVTRSRTAPTLGTTVDYNLFLGRSRRFLVGLGIGARRPLGVRAHSGPLDDPLIDPRVQFGVGF
jgi:hypothetical protein